MGNYAMGIIFLEEDMASLEEVVITGYSTKSKKTTGSVSRYQEYADDEVEEASAPTVTQVINQTTVEFDIESPYTIPNDGKEYAVEMTQYSLPATYDYYCAPKLDTDVFLTAQVSDWAQYNLLRGESNLFFEGTYLGKSLLDVDNTSDTLNISLGRDKSIVVSREKLKDFSSKQFIGANQKINIAWEINVRNNKKQAINITIQDQFPISMNKEIQVEKIDYEGAILKEDTSILTWKYELGGGKSEKLGFRYEVKYPKGKTVPLE